MLSLGNNFFRIDSLSGFIGLFIVFFTVLTVIYSFRFFQNKKGIVPYYLYLLLTAAVSLGVVFANHMIVLMVCWGFLGLLLYLLVGFGEKERTPQTARKTLIIVGGTDAFMILGLSFLWALAKTFTISQISLALDNRIAVFAYLCLAVGALAKAGAIPFHTWVPDVAEDAPTPVTAFLPASLDKLLGIYFLARLSLDIFHMNPAMNTVLMVLGSATIIFPSMMALVQNDFKRLLGYTAVSQVGYMVLGIGTGNPLGIAGSLFHMVNHAIYKSCLFLSAGAVEKQAGTSDMDRLGGYAKIMPITFTCFLVAALATSGVPPLNGFASKWMIYQGIVETGKQGGFLWIIWLLAAMVGSALTLANFMKLLHAIFLGLPSQDRLKESQQKQEAVVTMLFPIMTLAALCILFGVFAYQIPLKLFILPSIKGEVAFAGIWNAGLATILIMVGLVIGLGIFLLGTAAKPRTTEIFVGGETLKDIPEMRTSGTEFYKTIEDIGFLKMGYSLAQKKLFDIYDVGAKIAFGLNKALRTLHNGVLPTYISWCLLGMLFLFYRLLK